MRIERSTSIWKTCYVFGLCSSSSLLLCHVALTSATTPIRLHSSTNSNKSITSTSTLALSLSSHVVDQNRRNCHSSKKNSQQLTATSHKKINRHKPLSIRGGGGGGGGDGDGDGGFVDINSEGNSNGSILDMITEVNLLKISSYVMISCGIIVKLCTDALLENLCGFTQFTITRGLRVFFSCSGSYMMAYGILVYKLLIDTGGSLTPEEENDASFIASRNREAIGSATFPLLIEMITGIINDNSSYLGYHPIINYIWSILYGTIIYSCFQQTSWCSILLKVTSIIFICTSSFLAFAPKLFFASYGMTSYGVPPVLAESIYFIAKSNGYLGLMFGWLIWNLTSYKNNPLTLTQTLLLSWIPMLGYTIDGMWIGKQAKLLNLRCCTFMFFLICQIGLICLPTMARLIKQLLSRRNKDETAPLTATRF